MNTLFYEPSERVEKIRIKSSCFGIDKEYGYNESNGCPIFMYELFALAKCDSFEEVEVYLISNNRAYLKPSKLSGNRTDVKGWFSLKGIVDGNGYHKKGKLK